jgi:predicted nucleic acid-binding protein
MIWIVDASVAVRWFLKDEQHPNSDAVLRSLIDMPEDFAVPELFCFEVCAVLSRVHPKGCDVFVEAVLPIINGGIFRQPMTENLAKQADRFVKKGLTGYDACYAALAREMKGIWLTFDEKAHTCLAKERISHLMTEGMPKNWP